MVWRPQTMELFKLTTPKDDAWKVIETLGHESLVQFMNMNEGKEVTKLIYQERIKLCEETERRILFLLNTCSENLIQIHRPENVDVFMRNIQSIENEKKKSHEMLFDSIETEVRDCESFVTTQRETIDDIKSNISKLEDYEQVIEYVQTMTASLHGARPAQAASDAENPSAEQIDSTLQFIAGTVKQDEMERMKKMLFRITRGKALTHYNPFVQDGVDKVAYLVVFSAAGGNKERVQKVCDSFMGQRFEIPEMSSLNGVLLETKGRIQKSKSLYNTSLGQLKDYLFEMNSSSNQPGEKTVSTLEIYKWFVAKEKAIYHALNQMSLKRQTFIGFVWVPADKEHVISQKLAQYNTTEFKMWIHADGKGPIRPSSYKSNAMLEFHQISVDTYKFATYGEINPAIFQIVTFPFLFAVMYGDYGHGALFFLLGAVLCIFSDKIKQTSMAPLLVTRYFWLMMGFFSMFQGLIYNEFFAIPNDWFGTCYDLAAYNPVVSGSKIPYKGFVADDITNTKDCVYYFGMDPLWPLSPQYLTFTNNIKEKLSVIIAYFHLNFGMVLSALNAIHQKKWQKLIFDIFTGFFIFLGLIGFMIILIYVKWWFPVNPYQAVGDELLNISTSPPIINLLIGDVMGLLNLSTKNELDYQFWSSQQKTSNILVYITFICLPIMLCAIPCIALCCGPKAEHHEDDEVMAVSAQKNEEEQNLMDKDNGEMSMDKDFNEIEEMLKKHCPQEGNHDGAGEIFIHQIIETIEFVLGCISNTASYLRLWALSLAHGQLGEVFIQICFTQFFSISEMSKVAGVIYMFITGFLYMFAVMAVLLMMDCLEVFLHTMRLHWVEFMGKFYEGAGIPYKPFSFKEVFEKEQSRKDIAN